MDLNCLNTLGITKFFDCSEFACKCGRTHSFLTHEVIFEENAISRIGEVAAREVSPCAKVFLLFDGVAKKNYERSIGKRLASFGLRVQEVVVLESDDAVASVELATSVSLDEDARAIVAVGGEELMSLAKYIAALKRLSLIAVPTSPACLNVLSKSAILLDEGIEQVFKAMPPSCVIFDTKSPLLSDSVLVASAFGAVSSKLVGLYDYMFAAYINKEFFCRELFELGYAIVDSLICELVTRDSFSLYKKGVAIAQSALKLSAITQLMDNSRLFCGGEAQSAHILRLLFSHEERKLKKKGENELILARLVVQTYKNALTKPRGLFVPPPDNNLRMERINEFLGLDEIKLVKRMRPILSAEEAELHAYRVGEFFDELMAVLSDLDFKLRKAWRSFKRMYADDGFSLLSYLDDGDISLCLSFAPDLKEKFTMLTYLKDAGMLEDYVIVG